MGAQIETFQYVANCHVKLGVPWHEWPSDPTGHSRLRTDPATSVSGESDFESAEENPYYRTGQEENPSTREETKQPVEENPYLEESETNLNPLASSIIIRGELWTELRPPNSPIENLFSQILEFWSSQNPTPHTNIMATPVTNGTKEITLNKPDAYDGNRENFKKFLQDIEIYMDVTMKSIKTISSSIVVYEQWTSSDMEVPIRRREEQVITPSKSQR